jgi:molybdate transport system substrate-binding protein
LTAAVVALALAGCGGGEHRGGRPGPPPLIVSAASSLNQAFTAYAKRFPEARAMFSFAGSDQLAAQIEQGLRPDVYAAANTTLPDQLYRRRLVEKPVVFARNRLVLAVPAEGAKVTSLPGLAADGVKIAIGAKGVPIGSYTRAVLARLPAPQREAILANVRSEEPDVAGVTGKLTQGAVDAAFLYASDVRAAGGKLRAIALPDALLPAVAYGAAVVRGARHPAEARAFVAGLLRRNGARALAGAGLQPPPGR